MKLSGTLCGETRIYPIRCDVDALCAVEAMLARPSAEIIEELRGPHPARETVLAFVQAILTEPVPTYEDLLAIIADVGGFPVLARAFENPAIAELT
jgi:hypothetical protein